MSQQPLYTPEIFNQQTLEGARNIILTAESGKSADERWGLETAWLAGILKQALPTQNYLTLDFGCGVGRMSKALIEAGHYVQGLDISQEMRVHAMQAGLGDQFSAISPAMLDKSTSSGLRFDLALSVWVLQHCPNLEIEVSRIYNALRPGGVLFVVDMNHRAIPTNQGWVADGKNVFDVISTCFELIQKLPFNFPGAPEDLQKSAWLGFFRKK